MDINSLLKSGKVTRVTNAVAAGTTDSNSSSVDMQGFESVMFIALFGTITATAVTSIHAEQSADDSTFADLESTSISIDDDEDNMVLVLEVIKPTDRYVRCVVDRGTANAVIDGVIAIQYNARNVPTTQDATTVADSESHVEPDEGTV